jgi:hypothetical protein
MTQSTVSEARSRLGELLLELKLVGVSDLRRAEQASAQSGQCLPRILTDWGIVGEERLAKSIAARLGLEVTDVTSLPIHRRVLALVSPEMARRHSLLPIAIRRGASVDEIYVAMSDPLDDEAVSTLHRQTGLEVRVVVGRALDTDAAIQAHYGRLEADAYGDDTASALTTSPAQRVVKEAPKSDWAVQPFLAESDETPREQSQLDSPTVQAVLFRDGRREDVDLFATEIDTPGEEDEEELATRVDAMVQPTSEGFALVFRDDAPVMANVSSQAMESTSTSDAEEPMDPETVQLDLRTTGQASRGEARVLPSPWSQAFLEVPVTPVLSDSPFDRPMEDLPIGVDRTAVLSVLPMGAGFDVTRARSPSSLEKAQTPAAERTDRLPEETSNRPIRKNRSPSDRMTADLELAVGPAPETKSDPAQSSAPNPAPPLSPMLAKAIRGDSYISNPPPSGARAAEIGSAQRLVEALERGETLASTERAQLVLAVARLLLKQGLIDRQALIDALLG